ncbi:MAG: hypothetical protein ACREDX_01960 [Aestuariivirga sp.]
MLIQGFPVSAKLPKELGMAERFWYWQGRSGRNYIHSIYASGACPPLPGAVYVAVRLKGAERHAIATGRFPNFWEGSISSADGSLVAGLDADEIHVHLLARNDQAADAVLRDLDRALPEPTAHKGFNETAVLALAAA